MSLQTRSIPPIPDLTAQVARRAFRKGNVYMRMRDVPVSLKTHVQGHFCETEFQESVLGDETNGYHSTDSGGRIYGASA